MTPAAQIAGSIALLQAVAEAERPPDAVASAFFRARRYIGAKDRAALAERLYAVLRRHARLDWWLARLGGPDDPRRRIIAHLALWEQRSAAEIARLFSGGQYAPEPLSRDEQALLAALEGQPAEPPEMPQAVRLECPAWAEAPLRAVFGDRFEIEMTALLQPAALDLRVNEFKTSRPDVLTALAATGLRGADTPWSPLGIRMTGRPAVANLPLFRNGLVEIQDEGSQIAALLTDVEPGMQIVDFCAGAGGKSLALGARMAGRGRVVACDVSAGRLARARERIRRAGLDNIEPRQLESERDRWVKRQKGKFDRVLVDAPCTGTGAWRRNPDARWRPADVAALTQAQAAILASASRLVRPGGRLVYVTCSLLQAENEDQIAALLAARPDLAVRPVGEVWPAAVGGPAPPGGPFLRLTPAQHGTDGFFVAILERRAAAPADAA